MALGLGPPVAGSILRCQAIQSAVSVAVPPFTTPELGSYRVALFPPRPGIQPLWSLVHMMVAEAICRMLLRHLTCRPDSRALLRAGRRIPISKAIIPITTRSSTRVNAERLRLE